MLFFKLVWLNQQFVKVYVVNATVEFLTYCLYRRLATPKSALQNINFQKRKKTFKNLSNPLKNFKNLNIFLKSLRFYQPCKKLYQPSDKRAVTYASRVKALLITVAAFTLEKHTGHTGWQTNDHILLISIVVFLF